LRRERGEAYGRLELALKSPRCEGLLLALADLRAVGVSKRDARRCLRTYVKKAMSREHDALHGAPDELHALRRAVRRARFALEWLGKKEKAVESVQDAMGEFGDAWVALREARRITPASPTVRRHRAQLKRRLDKCVRRARRRWKHKRHVIQGLG
jgi:CHAD domain-containing protein